MLNNEHLKKLLLIIIKKEKYLTFLTEQLGKTELSLRSTLDEISQMMSVSFQMSQLNQELADQLDKKEKSLVALIKDIDERENKLLSLIKNLPDINSEIWETIDNGNKVQQELVKTCEFATSRQDEIKQLLSQYPPNSTIDTPDTDSKPARVEKMSRWIADMDFQLFERINQLNKTLTIVEEKESALQLIKNDSDGNINRLGHYVASAKESEQRLQALTGAIEEKESTLCSLNNAIDEKKEQLEHLLRLADEKSQELRALFYNL